jgi:hypothetical protein
VLARVSESVFTGQGRSKIEERGNDEQEVYRFSIKRA